MLSLEVVGNPDRYLAPLSAGSGYLVRSDEACVLLDAGQGIATRLPESAAREIDAVVVSHFHFDHAVDLAPILNSIRAGIPLVVPSGGRRQLDLIGETFVFRGPFEPRGPVIEALAGASLSVKDVRLDFLPTRHRASSFATRLRARGKTLVYTSDTGPVEGLADFARDADLFLAHTLMPAVDLRSDHAAMHLTAKSAAEIASKANARRLLLSHRDHRTTDAAMLAEARSRFPSAELAERRTYVID